MALRRVEVVEPCRMKKSTHPTEICGSRVILVGKISAVREHASCEGCGTSCSLPRQEGESWHRR